VYKFNFKNTMKMKGKSLAEYQKNRENPFISQAIEKIQNNVVKKYKTAAKTGERAILKAVDENGEIMGHTQFIRQIEVDEEQFTKFYLSQFSVFWDLKGPAIRVFGYIMTKLLPKQDMFPFFIEECMEFTNYKSSKSIYIGLASLVENEIIARGPSDSFYFINPMVAFNGDRVTFARSYVKKKKGEVKIKDPNQLEMFNETPPEPAE
jgi:hypothetical protein